MKYREKVFVQVIVCCMIFTVVKAGSILNIKELGTVKAEVREQFEKNYSVDEVKKAGSDLLEKAKETPATIANSVISANKLGEYGQPIDEDKSMKVRCVYASNAGKVIASGISKELGLFIKIRHDTKVSTYGNLSEIKVVQGDKVKKGDIIGTYESNNKKKFFYDLEENLQT